MSACVWRVLTRTPAAPWQYMGDTPLHKAAEKGWTATVDLLLAHGADGTAHATNINATNINGLSPADWALDYNHPMIVRKCDPALADKKGAELKEAFAKAKRVHVLSCRFNKTPDEDMARAGYKKMKDKWDGKWGYFEDESGEYLCTDPKMAASKVKQFLEEGFKDAIGNVLLTAPEKGVCVFNPNSDNAFLFGGDPLSANAAWVRAGWDSNRGLSRARLEGPTCRVPVR